MEQTQTTETPETSTEDNLNRHGFDPEETTAPEESEADEETTSETEGEETTNETEGEEVDEYEEVEYNGKKYKVEKELKDAFLRQQDYTKKSTEVAEQRKALEALETNLKAAQQVEETYTAAQVEAKVLEKAIDEYKNVDWSALAQQDPVLSQEHWIKYSQLMHQHNEAVRKLDTAKIERQSITQRETAKRLDDANKILTRDIPGWGAEVAAKLTHHAVTKLGFTDSELSAITDPRIVKMIHRDYEASKKVVPPKIKPAASVKGTSGVVKVDVNKLSDAEWLEQRRKQKR